MFLIVQKWVIPTFGEQYLLGVKTVSAPLPTHPLPLVAQLSISVSERGPTDLFSWTDHAQSFHPLLGVIHRFILLSARPSKDKLGERSKFGLRQVDPEEVLYPLPDPDSKWVLRGSQELERALEILPLQVDDRLIPVRCVLQVCALCPEAHSTAESLVLTAA